MNNCFRALTVAFDCALQRWQICAEYLGQINKHIGRSWNHATNARCDVQSIAPYGFVKPYAINDRINICACFAAQSCDFIDKC